MYLVNNLSCWESVIKHNLSMHAMMHVLYGIFHCSTKYCTNSFCQQEKSDEYCLLGWYMGPRVMVWVEIKGLCWWQCLPKWRDGAMNRRIDKVRTRSDRIVCQNKVSASLESTVKEDLGLDIPVSSTLECFWDRHSCFGGDIMESSL